MSVTGNSDFSKFASELQNASKDGKITRNESEALKAKAQEIVNDALKDGIIDDVEAVNIYKIGKTLEDTNAFDHKELKKSDGTPVDADVTKLFDMGISQRKNEKSTESQMKQAAVETSEGVIGMVASGIGSALEFVGLKDAADFVKSYNVSEQELSNIKKELDSISNRGEDTVIKRTSDRESDKVDCLSNAMGSIQQKIGRGEKWDIPKDAAMVDEALMEKWTGKKWDSINATAKSPEELKEMVDLKILEKGKSLVIDAGHAYVFEAVQDDGKIKVSDPSRIDPKTGKAQIKYLDPQKSPVSVFVQGKGDGDLTSANSRDKTVRTYSDLNGVSKSPLYRPSNSNDYNVDASGKIKTNESFQVRKLLVFMADPHQSAKFDQFKGLLNASKGNFSDTSIKNIQNFLKANGIELDDREVRAMVSVLTKEINPPKTLPDGKTKAASVIEMFDWMNNKDPQEKAVFTMNQTRFMSAIEYSNVDLNNYFSESTSPGKKAEDMFNVFNDVMNGKIGC